MDLAGPHLAAVAAQGCQALAEAAQREEPSQAALTHLPYLGHLVALVLQLLVDLVLPLVREEHVSDISQEELVVSDMVSQEAMVDTIIPAIIPAIILAFIPAIMDTSPMGLAATALVATALVATALEVSAASMVQASATMAPRTGDGVSVDPDLDKNTSVLLDPDPVAPLEVALLVHHHHHLALPPVPAASKQRMPS